MRKDGVLKMSDLCVFEYEEKLYIGTRLEIKWFAHAHRIDQAYIEKCFKKSEKIQEIIFGIVESYAPSGWRMAMNPEMITLGNDSTQAVRNIRGKFKQWTKGIEKNLMIKPEDNKDENTV